MPLYEYQCSECQTEHELLVRGGEEPEACPACGAAALEKLLSVPASPKTGGLPLAGPPMGGNCGLPQCGSGRCQFEG